MADSLPEGLTPAGATPVFTRETMPTALQEDHALAADTWGMLHVLEGSLTFVNLETGEREAVVAPGAVAIRPAARHHVVVDGPVRCRVDFFRECASGS